MSGVAHTCLLDSNKLFNRDKLAESARREPMDELANISLDELEAHVLLTDREMEIERLEFRMHWMNEFHPARYEEGDFWLFVLFSFVHGLEDSAWNRLPHLVGAAHAPPTDADAT